MNPAPDFLNYSPEDLLTMGREMNLEPEALASGLLKHRANVESYGRETAGDPEKFWKGAVQLDKDTDAALEKVRMNAERQALTKALPDQADHVNLAKQLEAGGYDPTQVDEKYHPALEEMKKVRESAAYQMPQRIYGGAIKVGETPLARYALREGSDGQMDVSLQLPDDSQALLRVPKATEEDVKQALVKKREAVQAAFDEEARIRKGMAFDPLGKFTGRDVAAKQRLEAARQDYFNLGKGREKYLMGEYIRDELKKPEWADKIGQYAGGTEFVKGVADAIISSGALVARIAGDENAMRRFAQGQADLDTDMPGSTRRRLEGGLWNDSVSGTQRALGNMAPSMLAGGATRFVTSKLAAAGGAEAVSDLARQQAGRLGVAGASMSAGATGNAYLDTQRQIDAAEANGDQELADRLRMGRDMHAILTGVAEGAVERLGASQAFNVGKGTLVRTARELGMEALEEPITGGIQRGLVNPVTLGQREDVTGPMLQEALTGLMAAGPLVGGSVAMNHLTGQPVDAPQQAPGAMPQAPRSAGPVPVTPAGGTSVSPLGDIAAGTFVPDPGVVSPGAPGVATPAQRQAILQGVPDGPSRFQPAALPQDSVMPPSNPQQEITDPIDAVAEETPALQAGNLATYEGYSGRLQQDGQRWVLEVPNGPVVEIADPAGIASVPPEVANQIRINELRSLPDPVVTESKFTAAGDGTLSLRDERGNTYVPHNDQLLRSVRTDERGRVEVLLRNPKRPGQVIKLVGPQAMQAQEAILEAALNVESQGGKVRYGTSPGLKNLRGGNRMEAGSTALPGAAMDALENMARSAVRMGQRLADWFAAMVKRFGESVRQYLQGAWQAAMKTSEVGAVDVGSRKLTEARDQKESAGQSAGSYVVLGARPGDYGWTPGGLAATGSQRAALTQELTELMTEPVPNEERIRELEGELRVLQGQTTPGPVTHPTQNKPRLDRVGIAAAKVLKSPRAKTLFRELFGVSELSVDPIVGTWLGNREPSFVLRGNGMTDEQAARVGELMGFAWAQDATVVGRPNPSLTEGIPAYFLGSTKRLSERQIDAIHQLAREKGIDFSTTPDGKSVQFLFFGEENALVTFENSIAEIQKAVGLTEAHSELVSTDLNETETDFARTLGAGPRQAWLDSSAEGQSLFERVASDLIAPYAKAIGAEGYRFNVDLFAKRFGLTTVQKDILAGALYPANGRLKSSVPILEGLVDLGVEGVTTKKGRFVASVTNVVWSLQNWSAKSGLIAPGDYSARAMKLIAQTITDEVAWHVRHAMATGKKSAIGWYDRALKAAKAIYAGMFSELDVNSPLYDADKAMVFDAMLGIASQGNNVTDNSVMAVRVYANWRRGGISISEAVAPVTGTFGGKTVAIENNYLKLEVLLANNTPEELRRFFNKSDTVGNINAYLRKNKKLWFDGKPLSVEGAAAQKVTGWMVFGPKIGSFINNLHGDYSTLTADLWFSRTWNRILGWSFIHSPELEAQQYLGLRDAMVAEYTNDTSVRRMEKGEPIYWDHGTDVTKLNLSPEEFDNFINDPQKMLEFAARTEEIFRTGAREGQEKTTSYKDKSAVRRAAKTWIENRENVMEAPRSDHERMFQQAVMEKAQKMLKAMGIDITIADMQAALWYNEKDLYAQLGATNKLSAPADYEDAARTTQQRIQDGTLFERLGTKGKDAEGAAQADRIQSREWEQSIFKGTRNGFTNLNTGRNSEAGFTTLPHVDALFDMATAAVQAGKKFTAWAREMVSRFGEAIRDYLTHIWMAAKEAMPARRAVNTRMGGVQRGTVPVRVSQSGAVINPFDKLKGGSNIFHKQGEPFRVNSLAMRQILTGSPLPGELVPVLAKTQNEKRAIEQRGAQLGNDLRVSIVSTVDRTGMPEVQVNDMVSDMLNGTPGADVLVVALDPVLHERTRSVRVLLDNLSAAVAQTLPNTPLRATIVGNLGSWLRRSYAAFDPASGWNYDNLLKKAAAGEQINGKDAADILNKARRYLRMQPGGPHPASEIEADLRDLMDRNVWEGALLGGAGARKSVSSLMQRKDIAPEIRAVMGEENNPVKRALSSLSFQAQFIARHHGQMAMRQVGLASELFSTQRGGVYTQEIPVDGPRWSGLGGTWTTPQLWQALQNAQGVTLAGTDLGGLFVETLKAMGNEAKLNRVAMNPDSWLVNMLGNFTSMVQNGDVFSGEILRRIKEARGTVAAGKAKSGAVINAAAEALLDAQRDMMARLTAAGVLGSSLTLADIEASLPRHLLQWLATDQTHDRIGGAVKGLVLGQSLGRGLGLPGRAVGGVLGAAGGYAVGGLRIQGWQQRAANVLMTGPDALARTTGWLTNYEAGLTAGMAPDAASDWATKRTLNTYPNYAALLGLMREGSRLGILGTFIAFQHEVYRNFGWNVRYAAEELRSGNPALVQRGAQRLAGIVAIGALAGGGLAAILALTGAAGGDDERNKLFRKWYGAPWEKDAVLSFKDFNDKGVTYFNTSYLLPQMTMMELLQAAREGATPAEGAARVMDRLYEQFIGGSVHLGPLLAAATNTNRAGRPLTYQKGVAGALERADYPLETIMEPGFAAKVEKIVYALRGAEKNGKAYSVEQEFKRVIGLREQTKTWPEMALGAYRDLAEENANIRMQANKEISLNRPGASARAVTEANAQLAALRAKVAEFETDSVKLGVPMPVLMFAKREANMSIIRDVALQVDGKRVRSLGR